MARALSAEEKVRYPWASQITDYVPVGQWRRYGLLSAVAGICVLGLGVLVIYVIGRHVRLHGGVPHGTRVWIVVALSTALMAAGFFVGLVTTVTAWMQAFAVRALLVHVGDGPGPAVARHLADAPLTMPGLRRPRRALPFLRPVLMLGWRRLFGPQGAGVLSGRSGRRRASSTRGGCVSRLYLGDFAALEAALAEEVRAAKERDALAPVSVVVGSAAVASRLPRVLAVRLGGHANVRVLTVHRLASQLAAAGGLPAGRLLTAEAQARLVERIVGQITSRAGSYFGPVAGMPGLARAFARSIEDLRQAGVSGRCRLGSTARRPRRRAGRLVRLRVRTAVGAVHRPGRRLLGGSRCPQGRRRRG